MQNDRVQTFMGLKRIPGNLSPFLRSEITESIGWIVELTITLWD